ncbi:MAG: hypothetical protein FRX48_02963 [Lasallia pustulata]|uniref:Uncharacterized protein n=1 Tax=Lasallia pustulata TaxID=136370 RepID=A0A5M8PVZ0_9LECA|nr:MAG: hypothetical protein FRX48_02963 [Lasallia pustulata]
MLFCNIIINVLTAITAVFVAHEAARTAGVDVLGYFLETLQIGPSSPEFFSSSQFHHEVSAEHSNLAVGEMVEPTLNHLPYLLNKTEASDPESEEVGNVQRHHLIQSIYHRLVTGCERIASFWMLVITRSAFVLRHGFEALGGQIYDPVIFAEFKSAFKAGVVASRKPSKASNWLLVALWASLGFVLTAAKVLYPLYFLAAGVFVLYPQYIMLTSDHDKEVAHLERQQQALEAAALKGVSALQEQSTDRKAAEAAYLQTLAYWRTIAVEHRRSAKEAKAERNQLRQLLRDKERELKDVLAATRRHPADAVLEEGGNGDSSGELSPLRSHLPEESKPTNHQVVAEPTHAQHDVDAELPHGKEETHELDDQHDMDVEPPHGKNKTHEEDDQHGVDVEPPQGKDKTHEPNDVDIEPPQGRDETQEPDDVDIEPPQGKDETHEPDDVDVEPPQGKDETHEPDDVDVEPPQGKDETHEPNDVDVEPPQGKDETQEQDDVDIEPTQGKDETHEPDDVDVEPPQGKDETHEPDDVDVEPPQGKDETHEPDNVDVEPPQGRDETHEPDDVRDEPVTSQIPQSLPEQPEAEIKSEEEPLESALIASQSYSYQPTLQDSDKGDEHDTKPSPRLPKATQQNHHKLEADQEKISEQDVVAPPSPLPAEADPAASSKGQTPKLSAAASPFVPALSTGLPSQPLLETKSTTSSSPVLSGPSQPLSQQAYPVGTSFTFGQHPQLPHPRPSRFQGPFTPPCQLQRPIQPPFQSLPSIHAQPAFQPLPSIHAQPAFQPPQPFPPPFHMNGFRQGAPSLGAPRFETPTRQPNAAGQMFVPRADRQNNRQRAQQQHGAAYPFNFRPGGN